MRTVGRLTAGVLSAIGIAILGAPVAEALPNCGTVAPWTMQCERGAHTAINTSPNPYSTPGPFLEQPWLFPGHPAFGIGGWPWA